MTFTKAFSYQVKSDQRSETIEVARGLSLPNKALTVVPNGKTHCTYMEECLKLNWVQDLLVRATYT